MRLALLLLFLFPFALSAQPYLPVPGHIEAENYYEAGAVSVSPTNDEGGGSEISWMEDGTWMTYQIAVPEAGYYKFTFRLANGFSDDARLQLSAGNVPALSFIVPRTGGMNSWKTVAHLVYLTSGNQTIKVTAQKGIFSLNWLKAERSVQSLPGKVEAESYEVASDVQTESTADSGGGLNVGHIDDGDWMMYNVTLAQGGTYRFDFRVANAYGYGVIQIRNQNDQVLGETEVIPHTGGWQSWTTVSALATLPAGNQVLKLFATRGTFNFNWFEVSENTEVERQPSVITFGSLPSRTVEEGPFLLAAGSNNHERAIVFTSSDASVISLQETQQGWVATPLMPGQSTITAYQEGSTNFLEAQPVSQIQVVSSQPGPALEKIPVFPDRWYVLNNASNGLHGLFDGKTNENVHVGWGMVLGTYDAYYPLQEGEEMTLEAIKMFDYEGIFTDNPATLSVITSDWRRVPVATFTGDVYNGWVGPYPDRQLQGESRFRLDSAVSGIRYLVLTIQGGLPTELELYGSYQASGLDTSVTVTPREVKLKDMLGVNAYEWNFQDGNTPWLINESKVEMVKSFSGIRHYMDWEKLESTEGVYSYNPTLVGGWHYDQIYERCKAEGIEVLACLKTIPGWMIDTYPAGDRDAENVPVRFGKSFSDPNSYLEQSRVAFQYAARYGSNTQVNPALLSVYDTPRWPGDNPNTIRIGTGLIKYMECDNERDKWWKGRKGYQTAREYAANLSAFYDGHKGTMGPGTGVKNADPDMQVVIAGLVSGPEYIRGMVDWCREFRGYKPDGSVDLCWDIINYHIYTDNTSSSQSGTSTRGAAPEVTNAAEKAKAFIRVSDELCEGMPVWITETGFDIHQDSPLKAVPIGNKSALETQADWILRTSLFSARHGISKVFFYQMYDDNDSGGIFATSGLINSDLSRRPAADYLYQTKKLFGEYIYKETLSADPVVDRYELEGNSMYVLMIPDEVGRTASYSLSLGNTGSARVYRPLSGAEDMMLTDMQTPGGVLNLTVGETPVFVLPGSESNARKAVALAEDVLEVTVRKEVAKVYPNPVTSGIVHFEVENPEGEDVEIFLFHAGLGTLHYQTRLKETGSILKHKLDMSALPKGHYIVDIRQKHGRTIKKLVNVE